MDLRNGDCLEVMKELDDDSVDLLFADLPYAQTSCKWDVLIDLELFWKEVNRVCKLEAAMVFTCTTKFGVSLINSNKKNFRYDLVWVKSAPSGFLCARKQPMRKHEMVYFFYRKQPSIYNDNLSLHHKHKFLKEEKIVDECDNSSSKTFIRGKKNNTTNKDVYNSDERFKNGKLYHHSRSLQKGDESIYDPPLPNSIIKETNYDNAYSTEKRNKPIIRTSANQYDPKLPTSIIKEEVYGTGCYQKADHSSSKNYDGYGKDNDFSIYQPPLPNSVVKEENCKYDVNKNAYGGGKEGRIKISKAKREHEVRYEPPLPNTILEVKSQRGKHPTQKPVALMEWVIKYYTKEGDVVLDPCMGSGSTGEACKNLKRNFIGIEMNQEIFEVAFNRLIE